MAVRQNILEMPIDQVRRFTGALAALKADGTYDDFTRRHSLAMTTMTPAGSSRSVAHSGPAFGPWHRAFLLEFEAEVLAADPELPGLPYWQWEYASARNSGDPTRSRLWSADYLGSDGDPADGDRVPDGPFASWVSLLYEVSTDDFVERGTPGLVRRLGRDPNGSPDLPDGYQLNDVMENYSVYDASPWDMTVSSFRNRLEGWDGFPRMHNHVHRWVGGDMLAGTAPNDPVFWLHHANIDRIWWWWQQRYGVSGTYRPVSGGPKGHNLNDELRELSTPRTIASVLDMGTLGYRYV